MDRVIRRLSEFTWDFLLYTIIDFHPITAVVEILFLVSGPFYNRRLRKQLRSLTDSDLTLGPNDRTEKVLAFAGVRQPAKSISVPYTVDGADTQKFTCDLSLVTR